VRFRAPFFRMSPINITFSLLLKSSFKALWLFFKMLQIRYLCEQEIGSLKSNFSLCRSFANVVSYYELDNAFMREILGKNLTSRLRKDLDEISEKCGISLKSCRRQVDIAT
jgi:hypothetical protein